MTKKEFILSAITDPVTGGLSSTRVMAILQGIAGLIFAFLFPDNATMAGVLLGGGVGTFLARNKAVDGGVVPTSFRASP